MPREPLPRIDSRARVEARPDQSCGLRGPLPDFPVDVEIESTRDLRGDGTAGGGDTQGCRSVNELGIDVRDGPGTQRDGRGSVAGFE